MSTLSSVYLCYDLKGIQSFIFAIPRLRYICGGSALVDIFDRQTAKACESSGCPLLFSGGGKGAYACESTEAAQSLQKKLVAAAHEVGLSISFGYDADYNEAAHMTSASFPYLPESLEGQPCSKSGLYPVAGKGAHPVVKKRGEQRWHYEEELLNGHTLGDLTKEDLTFFSNVSDKDAEEWTDGDAGCKTLGSRNRWAVICMDGNNMGDQHRKAVDLLASDPTKYQEWLQAMSQSLDDCTRTACKQGIGEVAAAWFCDKERSGDKAYSRDGKLILPIRPLLVGGDDVVVLCHVDYAFRFVRSVALAFHESSVRLADDYRKSSGRELWPASGKDGLTISAGVLFAPVGLPLSTAIMQAEQLLASAKQRGRKAQVVPVPACVDWESVTEGLVDTIQRRRQQDLLFEDGDINTTVSLTTRPCTLDELSGIEKLAEGYTAIPGTIRHQVLPEMRKAQGDRRVFVERIRKHQAALAADLDEKAKGRWRSVAVENGAPILCTDVIDALLLLEESSRMARKTAGERS